MGRQSMCICDIDYGGDLNAFDRDMDEVDRILREQGMFDEPESTNISVVEDFEDFERVVPDMNKSFKWSDISRYLTFAGRHENKVVNVAEIDGDIFADAIMVKQRLELDGKISVNSINMTKTVKINSLIAGVPTCLVADVKRLLELLDTPQKLINEGVGLTGDKKYPTLVVKYGGNDVLISGSIRVILLYAMGMEEILVNYIDLDKLDK